MKLYKVEAVLTFGLCILSALANAHARKIARPVPSTLGCR